MTSTDLENKWFNIATPNKSQQEVNPGDRIPVGEKGIGRLSSESLGEQTVLTTNPKNETAGFQITFDWTKYQDKNALANEIINKGVKIKKKKFIGANNSKAVDCCVHKHFILFAPGSWLFKIK